MKRHRFEAVLEIIGINPFVFVPTEILQDLFVQAGKSKGTIPVKGTVNDLPYRQTLVRYKGDWRLYINMQMLKNSPQRIGERLTVEIEFDPAERKFEPPEAFLAALDSNPEAKAHFDRLSPSLKQEIVRYLARLKSEQALNRNVERAIQFLLGKQRFVGRDKP